MKASACYPLVFLLALPRCSPDTDPRVRSPAPPETASAVPVTTPPPDTTPEWRIVPGVSAGPITRKSSEAELQRHYGGSAVESARIELGEGETAPGTILFPGDSLRRMEILWQDSVARRIPARLILRGRRSLWHIHPRISLGTSLQELEQMNGRPFTLAGFGWGYSGVVTDWGGGALENLPGIKLYLDPGPAQYESAPYSQVLGDRDYSSALPAMQQLAPRVAQIFVDFE
jgi:hypothetical protein